MRVAIVFSGPEKNPSRRPFRLSNANCASVGTRDPSAVAMSYPLHHLEDTPNWEVGLRVHEAENRWLIREFDAVLRAYGHYARSLSPTGPFAGGTFGGDGAGVVDGIGGMLGGVLAGMESLATGVAAEDSEDSDEPRAPRGFNQPSEAAFAAALERVGTVAASEDDEMAAPMAAAVGAPLLGPIADALRAVGTCRESLGRRVRDVSLNPLRQFIDEDLREVSQLRDHYDHKKAACERAREHYLSRTTELARGKAQDELTAAKENLEAARARLALAACNVEGRRRYVLLESARETMQALHRFFADAALVTASLEGNLREIEEYAMASRAQAEMRMLQASRRMEATFGVTDRAEASASPSGDSPGGDSPGGDSPGADDDEMEVSSSSSSHQFSRKIADGWEKDAPKGAWGPRAWKPKNEREVPSNSVSPSPSAQNLRAGMSQGRSADVVIRKSLLEGATDGGRLGSRAIRRGFLMQRNANHRFSGWTRRYFVLDSLGQLVAHTPIEPRWKRPGGKKNESGADEGGDDGAGEGGHHGLVGTAVKGIAGGIGAVWHAVRQNAAPEPETSNAQSPAEAVVNLRLSCVKPGADEGDKSVAGRPHCFRIISPSHTLLMQAESEEEMNAWLRDLQGVIAELISMNAPGDTPQNTPGGRRGGDADNGEPGTSAGVSSATGIDARTELASVAGNDRCADCGEPHPDWASLNLCVVICQRCAGIHRHLGAHVSKVRSLALDRDAWTPPVLELFKSVGNDVANGVYEAARRRVSKKKTTEKKTDGDEDEEDDDDAWLESGSESGDVTSSFPPPVAAGCDAVEDALNAIRAKYVDRAHVDREEPLHEPGLMATAAGALDVPAVLHGLACVGPGANAEKGEALVAAARRGEAGAAVVGLLLANGARVDGGGEGVAEGEVLPVVLAALKAGCDIEGPVMGLLRNAAGVQGTLFNVPPSW